LFEIVNVLQNSVVVTVIAIVISTAQIAVPEFIALLTSWYRQHKEVAE
jgi:hypothetical protein